MSIAYRTAKMGVVGFTRALSATLLMMTTNSVASPAEAPFAAALINTSRAVAEATSVWFFAFIDRWRDQAAYWGAAIGAAYGEPFFSRRKGGFGLGLARR